MGITLLCQYIAQPDPGVCYPGVCNSMNKSYSLDLDPTSECAWTYHEEFCGRKHLIFRLFMDVDETFGTRFELYMETKEGAWDDGKNVAYFSTPFRASDPPYDCESILRQSWSGWGDVDFNTCDFTNIRVQVTHVWYA